MPWYALAYVVAYFGLSVVGDFFQLRDGTDRKKVWIESLIHLGVGCLMIGYWHRGMIEFLGMFAAIFFVLALLWECWSTTDDIRRDVRNGHLPTSDLWLTAGLTALLIGPAYVLAGLAAFG